MLSRQVRKIPNDRNASDLDTYGIRWLRAEFMDHFVKGLSQRAADFDTDFAMVLGVLYLMFWIIRDGF